MQQSQIPQVLHHRDLVGEQRVVGRVLDRPVLIHGERVHAHHPHAFFHQIRSGRCPHAGVIMAEPLVVGPDVPVLHPAEIDQNAVAGPDLAMDLLPGQKVFLLQRLTVFEEGGIHRDTGAPELFQGHGIDHLEAGLINVMSEGIHMGTVVLVEDQLEVIAAVPQAEPMPAHFIKPGVAGMGRHPLLQVLPHFHDFHILDGLTQLQQTHFKCLLLCTGAFTRSVSFLCRKPAG